MAAKSVGEEAAKPGLSRSSHGDHGELVILTGMSGSGKLSALKAFEDLGYYSVDNLPLELIPRFADLVRQSAEIERAALVVDVREGMRLDRFPAILKKVRKVLPDARGLSGGQRRRAGAALLRDAASASDGPRRRRCCRASARSASGWIRSATSRTSCWTPRSSTCMSCARTSRRSSSAGTSNQNLTISSTSFGFKNGVPADADLVFDVRFLPNPHFVPEFRKLTGRHPKVAKYVRQFPQTQEFLDKATDMLKFLLPHYIEEGKSYLTVAFGCTGGQHRSVFIAEEMKKRLEAEGHRVKTAHRDMPR